MTTTTTTFTKLELHTWNNGGTWQRARIAYRRGIMGALTQDELKELVRTVKDVNFIADMSDDYRVTCSEKRENNAIAAEAKALLGI